MNRNHAVILVSILGIFLQNGCRKVDHSSDSLNKTATPLPSPSRSISGKLDFLEGPFTAADASLNLYKDEQCVELDAKNSGSQEEKNRLDDCRKKEVVKVGLDEQGNYKLTPPNPGFYKLWIMWWSDKTLGGATGYRDVGDFQVLYAEKKTDTSKVYFLAVSKPFYFTGQEDMVKNLHVIK